MVVMCDSVNLEVEGGLDVVLERVGRCGGVPRRCRITI